MEGTNHGQNATRETVREVPLIPSRGMVLFPHMVVPWSVEDPGLVRLVDDALAADRTIAVVPVSPGQREGELDLRPVGTLALILRMAKDDEGHAKLLLQGVSRIRVLKITGDEPYLRANVASVADEVPEGDIEIRALVVNLRQLFVRVLELAPNLPGELGGIVNTVDDPGVLADIVVSHLNIPPEEKQAVLEAFDVKRRLEIALGILAQQHEILELGKKIQGKVKNQVEKTQKEFYLREQLKAIRRELGEGEEGGDEVQEIREKLEAKGLPETAMEEAERELARLARMHPSSSEYTVARTYLDWLAELPWSEATEDHLDIDRAERILDEDHYDLEKVKKRILEYLAVRKLKPDLKGPILCFAGPPGTGKTSLGKSIARAMGRKFLRISLGGVRDEAEIRGHRRTYVGAMPGRIIQGLRKVGVNNPVFMLDEIDKLGMDFRGDPASALLEVLDPEQNATFTDHYLGVEFDLSKVLFIATANVLDAIPGPLLDRMEVIELAGYTLEEKLQIARKYLIPRQLEAHGLTRAHLTFDKRALERLITAYTREAGVRNLEREIAAVCRGVAKEVAKGRTEKVRIRLSSLQEYLGPARYESEVAERTRLPGVATGLAWTPTGGEILFIEATKMKGPNRLILTGKLGEVMKESAQTALSYIHSKAAEYKIPEEAFQDQNIHIHVPAGAIPKDGPSAGVTIAVALLSLFTDRPVRPEVAMTGEISLRGLLLPVGGIKEKVLAAHRAGIKEVILPRRNAKDLEDVPEPVRKALTLHLVSKLDDAAAIAFRGERRKKPRD
ncbi:endopeptidase La [Dissulfurirhabdus thermomarina]|uniref:Lon protease n=1 Tax=Dissulfurirhabdus thermomarina TaxID=1765737 RepID=A0A6N9TNP2_DISTH|nr:endopeptidase La [Dissulfurirhabdus thermomarina]NDY42875.1 endopeptidase La [Dissulfurirhabdus thermomarina]NMX24432.1 endopeptidase La [Dissulfurirhabdus thermomarina]